MQRNIGRADWITGRRAKRGITAGTCTILSSLDWSGGLGCG